MDRVDNQAGDKVPAARTAQRADRMASVAVGVPVRVKAKAKVAVADREKAAARDGVAVNIL
jgi:hypothetical protein